MKKTNQKIVAGVFAKPTLAHRLLGGGLLASAMRQGSVFLVTLVIIGATCYGGLVGARRYWASYAPHPDTTSGLSSTNVGVAAAALAGGGVAVANNSVNKTPTGQAQTASGSATTTGTINTMLPDDPMTVRAVAYGVIPNAANDQTALMQSALSAAAGKTLFISPGSYVVSMLSVSGPARIIANGVTLKPTGGSKAVITIRGSTSLEGIAIDGTNSSQVAIAVYAASDVSISGCHLTNNGNDSYAMSITRSNRVTIDSCTIENSRSDAIDVILSNNGVIKNTTITNSGRGGIAWWGGNAAASTVPGLNGLTIINNTVTNIRNGCIWGSLGQNITASNNTVTTCGDVGIDMEGGTNAIFTSNTVHNAKNGGMTTFHRATNVQIINNTIVQDPGYGSGIETYGSGVSTNVIIQNNTITMTNNRSAMFIFQGTLRDSTITNNQLQMSSDAAGITVERGNLNISISDNIESRI